MDFGRLGRRRDGLRLSCAGRRRDTLEHDPHRRNRDTEAHGEHDPADEPGAALLLLRRPNHALRGELGLVLLVDQLRAEASGATFVFAFIAGLEEQIFVNTVRAVAGVSAVPRVPPSPVSCFAVRGR